MPLMNHPIAFARTACSASSLQRYAAVSTTAAAAQPKTKPLIHSVSRRFSRLLFACAPLLLGAAALVPAAPAQAQVVNICNRTPEVETAILAKLSHSDCSAVTSAQLAGIGGALDLSDADIASLQASDFSGLSSLTDLDLRSNALTSLPEGVFSGLSSLEGLVLSYNALTNLPEGVFSGLSRLTGLYLSGNGLTSLPEGVFSGLSRLIVLDLQSNGLTSLPDGVFSGLSTLNTLYLGINGLTSLPAGVFSGLSSLTGLNLNNNSLSSLPEGVFSGLRSLAGLWLHSNTLTSLPEGVFSGLSSLKNLWLYNNALTSLPSGVFSGLSSLTQLWLSDNSGASFQVALSLEVDSVNRAVRILVPLGAPEDLAIPLSISGGTVAGSTIATITIPTGATASPAVTVDFADTKGTATVSFGTLPALTPYRSGTGIRGLTLVAGDAVSFSLGICDRTPEVETAILAELSHDDCSAVTSAELAGIGFTIPPYSGRSIDLSGMGITSLQAGDFSGLSSLTKLGLQNNDLTSLPAGVFSGLSSLEYLSLKNNALTSLPEGVFSGLSSLTTLLLDSNDLTSLPEGVFSGLDSLTTLWLQSNDLTSLPEDVFSGLISLGDLRLQHNDLTSLPEGVFSGLSSLTYLDFQYNALTSLPSGVFSGLSSLTYLYLHGNALTSLPEGVFSGLSSLTELHLFYNALTSLPAGVFSGLSSLQTLRLLGNALTSLPAGVFSGLGSLTTLRLDNNGLTSLPSGVFSGLSSLTYLDLRGNGLTSLPVDEFSGLSSLTVLRLSGNSGAPFEVALSLKVDSANRAIRILAPLNAPEDLAIPLSISGGTVAGSTTPTVTIPAGTNASPLVAVDFANTEGTATVSFGTLPASYNNIDGLAFVTGDALTFAVNAESFSQNICERTAQVRAAIRAKLGNKSCTNVIDLDLAGISGSLDLNSQSIASLKAGDLRGLTSLHGLDLGGNQLTSLPTGIFSDLNSLNSLDLSDNRLVSLSGSGLDGLAGVQALDLSGNSLSSLPDEIFNSAGSLATLDLSGNPGAPFTVTLSPVAGDFNTVRVQMTASAWTALGVPLVASNGQLSWSRVIVVPGATLSNAATFTPDSDPDTVSTVGIGTLPTLPASFTGIALAKGPSLTMVQGGICNRSPKVRAAIINALSGVSDCGAVTATHLASLTGTLMLGASGAATLQAGDFAGLSGLTGLDLANRSIASLPQDVFGDLAKVTTLNLSGNSLAELPAGVFAGLSSLSSVDLSGNSGAPFTLPLVLREDGSGRVHVYLEHGAPKTLSIPLEVRGGSLSASSVSIAVGQTISASVTFTADSSGDAMTVSFARTLPSAGTGVQLGAGGSLTLVDDGICARTPEVRDAILARLSHNDCSAVTRPELAGIDGSLDLASKSITSLRYGDFSGLSGLTGSLGLDGNELKSLPAGVFSGLSSLSSLRLWSNALTSLPEGVFSGLSSLRSLFLTGNNLTNLPEGVFSELSNLTSLSLSNNNLTNLRDGVFSGLSILRGLYLNSNNLTNLPDGVFSGLGSLKELSLSYNRGLTSLPDGVFSGSGNLEELNMYGSGLTSLPDGVFSGLSGLVTLRLNSNRLTNLPEGMLSGLSNLVRLRLAGNSGAPFQVELSLESDPATRTIRILAPLGAPEELAIPLSISGGTVAGSTAPTVTIEAGATASSPVTVDFAAAEGAVTVSFGTLPTLTPYSNSPRQFGIDGLILVAGDTVGFSPGICGRTEQVRTAIKAKLGNKACSLVTDANLAGISGTLSINSASVRSLQAGDFSGLTGLQGLELRGNTLTNLPTGILGDLTSLTSLDLGGNDLASVSGSGLDGLTSLQVLRLNGNKLTGLPANLLSKLTALTELNLSGNGLLTLPTGLLTGLTSLTDLDLSSNALTSLSGSVFGALTSLTELKLNNNQLASLPATLLSALTSLTELKLNNNQLSELPAGLFSGLTSLIVGDLDFRNNKAALALPMVLDYQRSSQSQGSLSVGLAIGAPVALTIPLQVAAGTATLSASTVTLAAGGVSSGSITVTRGAGNANITLSFGTLPVLTNTGLTLGQGANVILSVPVFSTASLPNRILLQNSLLIPVKFGEASGLDTPLTHVLSATTSTSGVTLTNGLPTGLSFDAAARQLTGTPTTPGVYALTYTATDNDGDTATQTLSLTVEADASPSFGAGTVAGQSYEQFVAISALALPAATGGNGALVYSLSATTSDGTVDSADTLPAGLDFAAGTRTLYGTPTAAGTYAMTYSASDEDGDNVSLSFQLVVDSVPTLANANIGNHAYVKDQAIDALVLPQAEGGTGTVSYSLTASTSDGTLASSLPAGLAFAASTRTLSGTPTAAGTYTMTYTATDTDSDSDARTFELTVAAFVLVCGRTTQVSDALVARLKGDGTLSSSQGCAQVTDSMLSALDGTLDVSNPSTKLTALVASDFSGLSNLEVLDLSGNSLTASGLPGNVFSSLGSLTELNLADNDLSAALSANLLAGLGTLQKLSLADNALIASHFPGTLFANTALQELDLSSNSLSGGLPSALPATLTGLALRDSGLTGLPAGFFTKFSALTTLDLTDNTVALTLQLHYLGNNKIQARLPEGAPWPLTVSVSGVSGSGTQVSPGSISLTQGETASAELQVSGYPATISLGSLPSVPASHSPTGLTLAAGGSLTLTVPTFSVTVADSLHTAGVNLSVQLPVATSGADSITYDLSVSTDDGALNNNMPAGLSFSSTTRTFSGAATAAGTYAVTWTATDADGDSVDLTFNLVVEVDRTPYFAQSASIGNQVWPLSTNITAVPSGGSAPCTLGGDPLSPCQLPTAEGGNGSLQYSLTGTVSAGSNGELQGGLPTGLAFAAGTRQLSGTPTAVGTYSMTYSASDKEGDAVSLSFGIVVDGIPVFSATQEDLTLNTGVQLKTFALPASTGGNLPLTYSLTATTDDPNLTLPDNLPAGLQFAPNTRLLTGTPTVIGTYQLTYSVTDSNGSSPAPIEFTIQVMTGVNVCGRGVVTTAIVKAVIGDDDCSTIDSSDLATITSLTVVSNQAVTLKSEYFAGLPALTTLDLNGIISRNLDSKLGTGLLGSLSGLEVLRMSGVGLDRLLAGSFAGLAALEELDLSGNNLGNALQPLPAGLLGGLDNLTILNLSGNGKLDTLPAGLLDGLDNLADLNLGGNALDTLPAGLLEGLDKLTDLNLSGNPGAPFEFRVDLQLAGRTSGLFEVTAAVARPLPLPVPVTLEVRLDDISDQLDKLEIPATGAGDIEPLEVSDTRNSVRITRLSFGAGDTRWSGQHQAFAGVRLVAGEALILDAHPSFDATAVADQSYLQNTPIEPWQLPAARVLTPIGVSPASILLTYSLSATTDDPDLTLADNLPAGLVFNAATHTLTGAPIEVGTYRMTYSVVDDDGDAASLQFEVAVGGQEALYRQLHAQILSQYALTIATEAGRAVAERVDRLAQGQAPRFATNADGSEFEIPLRSQGGNWSLWRRDNGNDLSWKSASTWSWDGSITSWQMGADLYAGDSSWLAGFMMQNAEGEFDYSGGSGLAANLSGTYAVPVRSSHLYAGWAPRGKRGTSWVSVWGMAGLGSGEVSLERSRSGADFRSDADISMSHFGVAITPVRLDNGLRVQLRAETVQTTVDLGDAATSAGGDAMSIDASRQRALLEVSLPDLLKGEAQLKLSGELGSRTDDSGMDEESDLAVGMPDGSGTEIGVKLRYTSNYMTLELGTRSLSVDGGDDGEAGDEFEESGWYLSFNLTSRPGARGLALSLKPSWGNTSSGMDRLWEDDQLPGVGTAGRGAGAGKGRMNAELSYGFGLSGGGEAVLSPYSKISAVEGSAHSGAFGVRLKLGKAFDLNLEHSDQYGAEAQDGRGKFRLGGTLRL